MNKKAFTLAEVLITLAIIGVVAAVTIPNMMYNSWKEQTVTSLQKVESTWKNAIQLAEREYGGLESWTFLDTNGERTVDSFLQYFQYEEAGQKKNFFYGLHRCNTDCNNSGCDNVSKCKFTRNYKTLSGTTTNAFGGWTNRKSYDFITGDGMGYFVQTATYQTTFCMSIAVDINGNRGPNMTGMDLFYFLVCNKSCKNEGPAACTGNQPPGFYPYGIGYGDSQLVDSTAYGCSKKSGIGTYGNYYCAAKIIKDGWQINY